MKNYYLAFIFAAIISACSDDKSHSDNSVDSGNKFYDSAVKKVIEASPSMTLTQGKCIIDSMTKDGKIGLGEINQMTLNVVKMSENASHLNDAYDRSVKACTALQN